MTDTTQASRSDLYLRFTRRSLIAVLTIILTLGIAGILIALRPDSAFSHVAERSSWMVTVGIVIAVVALQSALRGHRFTPDSPEVKAVMDDELRRASMDRARKFAFIVVLGAQMPMALLLAGRPSMHALLAMGVATITLGMTVLIALFLVFDRE